MTSQPSGAARSSAELGPRAAIERRRERARAAARVRRRASRPSVRRVGHRSVVGHGVGALGGRPRRPASGAGVELDRQSGRQPPVTSVHAFVQASKSVQMSPRPSRHVGVGVFQY